MQIGDLVKVIAEGLRPEIHGLGLVTKMEPHTDSRGTVFYCYARMVKTDYLYKFRVEHLEVISEKKA